jgi:hypothetical protein
MMPQEGQFQAMMAQMQQMLHAQQVALQHSTAQQLQPMYASIGDRVR